MVEAFTGSRADSAWPTQLSSHTRRPPISSTGERSGSSAASSARACLARADQAPGGPTDTGVGVLCPRPTEMDRQRPAGFVQVPVLVPPQRAGRGGIMPTPVSQAVSIEEAARRLGVHRDTVRAAIDRGEIRAARLGRRWLVPLAALDHLLFGRDPSGESEP